MPSISWPIIARIGTVLVLLVLFWWGFLFNVQRQVLFPVPDPGREKKPPRDATVVWLQGKEGETEAWYLPPAATAAQEPFPLIIVAHGNATLIDEIATSFDVARKWGMGVLLVEYPGYGRSKGRPTQESISDAMTAAFDWAQTQPSIDRNRIVGHGRSLGGGAICQLARCREMAALILESTFTSTRPFAARYGAPGFLVLDPFDNVEVVQSLSQPMIFFHGDRDEVIPLEHGKTLAKAAGATLHVRSGGHNDMAEPWGAIKEFLIENGLLKGAKDEGSAKPLAPS